MAPGQKAGGKGSQENCSATTDDLGFYGDGLSFRVVLSQSFRLRSFLAVHTLFSQDEGQGGGFWEAVRHVVSLFDLS